LTGTANPKYVQLWLSVKGAIEGDESHLGGQGLKGQRGRGACQKPVFGIFKPGGKVYPEVVPDRAKATLEGIVGCRLNSDRVFHADGWRG
jgi:hypothetical protein